MSVGCMIDITMSAGIDNKINWKLYVSVSLPCHSDLISDSNYCRGKYHDIHDNTYAHSSTYVHLYIMVTSMYTTATIHI